MNIYTLLELFMKLKTNVDTIKKTYIIKTQYFFPRISRLFSRDVSIILQMRVRRHVLFLTIRKRARHCYRIRNNSRERLGCTE